MTVCVSVKVNDCIVFAADSASSMVGVDQGGQQVIRNVYDHGQKVFNLYKGLPIVAMTCGMGNIAGSSIDVVAKDFRGLIGSNDPTWHIDPAQYTIDDVVAKAEQYFYREQYLQDPNRPTGDHSFEFFVGGIPSGSRLGEVWKFSILNGTSSGPIQVVSPNGCGVVWAGQPEALNRLVLGYSGRIPEILRQAGIVEPQLSQLINAITANTQAELLAPAMPVRDAIDLAVFLVSTTIDFTKYLPGANTVGGAIDVATVTRHEGFKWIKRKHYYPSDLNPLETDHVGQR